MGMRKTGIMLAAIVTCAAVGTAPAVATTRAADRPGLSGSQSYGGNTVTWATGGVGAVPSSRPDLAAAYDGIVKAGDTLTFSGSMSFSIPAGAVTNLSQQASLSGGGSAPTAGFSQRVGEGTYTTPFAFSVRAPWVKGVTPQENGVAATMVAYASSKNCNDSGVCGGVDVTLTFAIMSSSGGGSPSTENQPPTISVLKPGGVVPIDRRIPVAWRVADDSGRAAWFGGLYSGGTLVAVAKSPSLVRAVGQVDRAEWPRSGGGDGPFYECFYAKDSAGLLSAGAPMSSCQWVSVQVPIPAVSNGCGAATWGPQVAEALNWAGDVRMYGSNPVNIRPACNQHDAGYAGVTVAGMTTQRATDFRTWSREQVDQKFYDDIMKQCRRFLKGPANAEYLKACRNDAYTYVGIVRQFGKGAFDANSTVPGVQTEVPASTVPPGGARSNA
jgi:hypothetical protein